VRDLAGVFVGRADGPGARCETIEYGDGGTSTNTMDGRRNVLDLGVLWSIMGHELAGCWSSSSS
jgi:hypothetical protein